MFNHFHDKKLLLLVLRTTRHHLNTQNLSQLQGRDINAPILDSVFQNQNILEHSGIARNQNIVRYKQDMWPQREKTLKLNVT